MKSFPLREDIKLQFRAEFFNIFNHADFANPQGSMASRTFGRVTATRIDPRIGQFALKLTF